ncbi:hypothetical protein Tco_0048381, partial [Tanacetum coccineum]
LNRSLDHFFEDYIELNDLNEPFELRKNQGDDLMPTIEEGEVIEEFRIRDDELNAGIDDYPRALMNVPIFVGTFSVMTNFVVLENMDAYRDEGMGDVSEEDKMNGILHSYQKLKGFYKGVLNLEPDYIQDAKIKEWLIRGHVSVHAME